jgi:Do/DeqQ family serine protease
MYLNHRRLITGYLSLVVAALLTSQIAMAGVIPRDVSLSPLVKQISPAVVNIATRGTVAVEQDPRMRDPMFRRFFNLPEGQQERETQSLGSGVIVDAEKGHVITNYHVVREADEITIGLVDNRQFSAEVVGTDEASDIALLKIDPEDLTALAFGNSNTLEVGDYVLAVGNPFGLGHTVTSGIVSAKGRSGLRIEEYEDFIQTDAAINRGNSGGALVNLQGELIGVNTAILGPGGGNAGIGFAIPSDMVSNVINQIIEYGEVSRGLLGVRGQAVDARLAEMLGLDQVHGAIITEVTADSAAAKAGLEESDVIVEVDGKMVKNFWGLRNIIGLRRPGEKIKLKIVRDGKVQNMTATLGENLQLAAATQDNATLGGATLSAIPDNHPLSNSVQGVMVEGVERGSSADREGLERGDIITSINQSSVRSMADAAQAIGNADRYLLKVQRGQAVYFVVIG